MQNENVQNLAAKIAQLIASESDNADIASIQTSLDLLHARLDKLESASASFPLSVQENQLAHPSLDKLNIAEAIADSIFGSQFKEKACTFETSKPCDHCSMCSSRGF